ncbi:hypothetical protein MBAV_004049 [Candidatus Magnetobacterium bavaricum]|uniref:Uncharacterized protein n=1 Tax=Candidatus Magnetobacterium bavaricum TaxID=29290 RepID=A0A0F3GSW6_9BACT|nr:hypothetical protein MBAV_004049 [Candidatus Magnetobacterium bavaricum]
MRNAPAFVLMRKTLNGPDELPFCVFCKSNPLEGSSSGQREQVRRETANILQRCSATAV